MGIWIALAVSLALAAEPPPSSSPPKSQSNVYPGALDDDTMGTNACLKKRVDRCGCHRIFGRRHCHPNRRTETCDAYAVDQRANSSASPSGSPPAVSRRTTDIESRLSSETIAASVEAT